MTNKDRIISLLGFLPAEDNSIEGALLDNGLTGTDAYDATKSIQVKTAALGVLELLLTTADTSQTADITVSSTKYDRNAVLARIKLLKGELGITDDSLPYVTSKKVW